MTGPSPVDRGKKGSKIHVLSEAEGIPLVVGVSAANTHDSTMLRPLVEAGEGDFLDQLHQFADSFCKEMENKIAKWRVLEQQAGKVAGGAHRLASSGAAPACAAAAANCRRVRLCWPRLAAGRVEHRDLFVQRGRQSRKAAPEEKLSPSNWRYGAMPLAL